MRKTRIALESIMPNALALEYQAVYGSASRNINVFDFVNNPTASGKCRVFGLGFSEKGLDLSLVAIRPFLDNSSDSPLVAQNRVKSLP